MQYLTLEESNHRSNNEGEAFWQPTAVSGGLPLNPSPGLPFSHGFLVALGFIEECLGIVLTWDAFSYQFNLGGQDTLGLSKLFLLDRRVIKL